NRQFLSRTLALLPQRGHLPRNLLLRGVLLPKRLPQIALQLRQLALLRRGPRSTPAGTLPRRPAETTTGHRPATQITLQPKHLPDLRTQWSPVVLADIELLPHVLEHTFLHRLRIKSSALPGTRSARPALTPTATLTRTIGIRSLRKREDRQDSTHQSCNQRASRHDLFSCARDPG